MPIIAKGKSFTPAPAGAHVAVCCDVIDLGTVHSDQWGDRDMLELRWQIAEVHEETHKPFLVTRRYGNSLGKKSALRKDLESWRGRAFTNVELQGFDVEKLLGIGCMLNVIHNVTNDGSTFANVASIMPLPKGMQALPITDYIRVIDRPAEGNGATHPDDGDDDADRIPS